MDSPDVVLITCHDLGRHLASYGVGTVHSPATDALAADGVRFAASFCTSPGCSPSRAALATGRYPHSNGVMGLAHGAFGWELRDGERHLASILRDAGYATSLFGLQHVTCRGDEEAAAHLGFHEVHPARGALEAAGHVEAFLSDHEAASRPLYLEVNFFEPHRPYHWTAQPDTERGVAIPAYLPDLPGVRDDFAALQGAIRVMDAAVGRIDAAIAGSPRADRTLFVFTTDHGLAMPRAKGTLFDAGIEVALIVRWPGGGIAGGRVVDDLVSNVDVVPTILDLVGVEVPAAVQGKSFAGGLRGGDFPRDAVFAEKTYHETYEPLRCIRTQRHKLIARFDSGALGGTPTDLVASPTFVAAFDTIVPELRYRFAPLELYDVVDDRLEKVNLAGKPEVAEIEHDLRRRLWAWMVDTDDPLRHGPIAGPEHHRTIAALAAP